PADREMRGEPGEGNRDCGPGTEIQTTVVNAVIIAIKDERPGGDAQEDCGGDCCSPSPPGIHLESVLHWPRATSAATGEGAGPLGRNPATSFRRSNSAGGAFVSGGARSVASATVVPAHADARERLGRGHSHGAVRPAPIDRH